MEIIQISFEMCWIYSSLPVLLYPMDSTITIAARRFKQIRESEHFTQSAFAKLLGINNSTADIERGKTKISGRVAALLLKNFDINPLWLFGLSHQKLLSIKGGDVAPKVITIDSDKNENVVLVNVKAAAGYPSNIQDIDWYQELPAFALPLPEYRFATYRGFQVEGDSMLPLLLPGDWVIAKAVTSIKDISRDVLCVVVLEDSVLVKKVRRAMTGNAVSLISLNSNYSPININAEEVLEIWEVQSKLSSEIDTVSELSTIQQLQRAMEDLKTEVKGLKN